MRHSSRICPLIAAIAILAAGWLVLNLPGPSAWGDEPVNQSEGESAPAWKAIDRGLAFLKRDTVKWREVRGCATCHHGTMTVWALSEAKNQGHVVDAEFLADTVAWTKERFVPRINKPRDPRPGWNLVSVPAIYLGVMSQNLPILSRDEINQVASHLASHQEEDGAWLMPPASNGAPPIWESRETLALLAYLAWEPNTPVLIAGVPVDEQAATAARASREKAATWLSQAKPTETVQAVTLRLLLAVRLGKREEIRSKIDALLKLQQPDGGWSQAPELASDAFATGQALYVLSFAGVDRDQPAVQRGVAFLVSCQREDGSWPMISRNHPGVESTKNPIRNPVPITYFGSAWAVLGLVRYVPPPLDSLANQRHAIDEIKKFHGKFEVDEKSDGRPVVRVDLRYYDVSDEEVENMAKVLRAFPKLESLDLKSAKMTNAGLAHLQSLRQLRKLSLEGTAITDEGLSHLKPLSQLQELTLKCAQVTEHGIQEFQSALPEVRISR